MKTIILITGYARAGKGTLAAGLELGAKSPIWHINFADMLKRACDSYMQVLDIGGSGSSRTFRSEMFKVTHRDFLVSAGTFARSIDKDVFALAFARECERTARCSQEPDLTIVCSDWRYLNELTVVNNILGAAGWRIYTVQIDTSGIGPANEEEGKSIGEIVRNVPINLNYSFRPDSTFAIKGEGKSLARQLGM